MLAQRFIRWFRSVPTQAGTPLPWRKVDRERWSAFLDSDSGKRFISLVRAWEAAKAIGAVREIVTTIHAAGTAKGYGDCIEDMISLSWKAIEVAKDEAPKTESEIAIAQMMEQVTP